MGLRFDLLAPRGEGIRIGGGRRRFRRGCATTASRASRVADYLDLTDGDTTDSSATTATTAPESHGTSGLLQRHSAGAGLQSRLLPGEIRLEHGEPRGRTPPVPGPGLARTTAGRRGQHLAGLYRISTISTAIRRRCSTAARRSARVFSTAACSMRTCAWSSYKAPATREKQMAPHLVPGDVAEAVSGRRGRPEGTGRSGKSGTGYYPHPRQARPGGVRLPRTARLRPTPVVTGPCAALMGVQADGTPRADPPACTLSGHPQRSAPTSKRATASRSGDTLLGFLDTSLNYKPYR